MNKPVMRSTLRAPGAEKTPCPLDLRPELRGFIHEAMGFARLYSETAQAYAEAGDDAMLEVSLRKLVAFTRTATETYNDLASRNRQITSDGGNK